MSLLELFVEVDDFCSAFKVWAASQQLPGRAKRGPEPLLSASEVMTIVIHFHQQGYRDFKHYYQKHVCEHLIAEFPRLVSYGRFVELMPGVPLLLCAYLQSRFGSGNGIAVVDTTPWQPVTIAASLDIVCSRIWPREAKRLWAGFMVSSST